MMQNGESTVAFTVVVLTFMEILQALNGSLPAFAACQDRNGYLSTIRTIPVATEQTFHCEKRPV